MDPESIKTAWENLETARHILQKRVEDPSAGEEERKVLINKLALVYIRIGDCECWQDKFGEAIEAYNHSLTLRQQIENPSNSRGIAEVYFMIANTLSYMSDTQGKPMEYYLRATEILQNILYEKYEKMGIEVVIPRERLVEERSGDDEHIKEIKEILKDLALRIEDAKLEESEREQYLAAKKKEEQETTQALNAFGKPIMESEENKVKNLGFFGRFY